MVAPGILHVHSYAERLYALQPGSSTMEKPSKGHGMT